MLLAACAGHQSTLAPFGIAAEETRSLMLYLAVAAAVILAAVAALAIHAMRQPERSISHQQGMRVVLWLGAIVPTVLLGLLLVLALPLMRPMASGPADLRIAVDGRQFWWHVEYRPNDRPPVASANEIRLPVGRTVVFDLTASDVVHSFWIPGLAGKMDMLPGRTNRLIVRATRAGRYRGVCAEFCGLSHALMAFDVIAMPAGDFDRWLAARAVASPAANSAGSIAFARRGCDACHSLSTSATATAIGPNLARLGERPTLGAGILPMNEASVAAFIRDPAAAKPGVRMPATPDMTDIEARAIARFLLERR